MRLFSRLLLLAPAAFALLLTGCGTGSGRTTAATPPATVAVHVSGTVHGGQQPVAGSTIQLYAVGITGLGSAATPLLVNPVMTNAAGNFTITGDWDCTSNTAAYGPNPLLYLVARGGNPGFTGNVSNAAIVVLAALGPCSGVTADTFVSLNEITTVAAVYALAPFTGADIAHIGAQGVQAVGIVNAFNMAAVLSNSASGSTPGAALPANVTFSTSEVLTLADMIADCVNSSGLGDPCATFFSNTTAPGATSAPVDVAAALLNVVRFPQNKVQELYNNIPGQGPYQPKLSAAPGDWTLSLNISGGGLAAPSGVAIDSAGNAWIANAGGTAVTELSPTGTALTGAAGYSAGGTLFGPRAVAVDRAGNIWIANTLVSSVVELTLSGGAVQAASTYTAGGITGPTSLAIDSGGNVWVTNFSGGNVTELSSAGSPVGASPFTANGTLLNPVAMAIDPAGDVWVTDATGGDVVEFSKQAAVLSGQGLTDTAMLAPAGLAIDSSGRAWVADNGTSAVSLFSPAGTVLLSPAPASGGLNGPAAVAIDGAGTVWICNAQSAGTITELNASGAAVSLTGYGALTQPQALAVDPSGNLWAANAGSSTVSILIGLAAPVMTPLAATVGR